MKQNESFIKRITGRALFLPAICLFLVLIANLVQTPDFFNIEIINGAFYGFIIDIINWGSGLIIMAVGMTLVVSSSGGADISVGSVSAVAGAICVAALGTEEAYQVPYVYSLLLALLAGMLCGAFNGFLVAYLKIVPMVATLILLTAGRGIAQLATGSFILYVKPDSFKYLGTFLPGVWIPTTLFVALFVVLITWLVLKRTSLGMYIQSVGINPQASRLMGLNSKRIIFGCYVFCGLCAAIAGLVSVSRTGSADANNIGRYKELDAIAAVAIGGNMLSGGKFSLIGSVIGAITIQALTTSLSAFHVAPDQQPLYKAVVVIIIVAIQSPELKRWIRGLKSKLSSAKSTEGGEVEL